FELACEILTQMANRYEKAALLFESTSPQDFVLFELILKLGEFVQAREINIALLVLIDTEDHLRLKNDKILYQNYYLYQLLKNCTLDQIAFPRWRPAKVHRYINRTLGLSTRSKAFHLSSRLMVELEKHFADDRKGPQAVRRGSLLATPLELQDFL